MPLKRTRPADDDDASSEDSNIDSSSDDADDDDEESSGPEEVVPRLLPARTTRGKRISTLVGEAAEADAQFWGQRAFEETLSDEEFTTESEESSSDSSDSDIDLPEPSEEPAPAPAAERAYDEDDGSKKKKAYVDPALRMHRAVVGSVGAGGPDLLRPGSRPSRLKPANSDLKSAVIAPTLPAEHAEPRGMRQSTLTASECRRAVEGVVHASNGLIVTAPAKPAPAAAPLDLRPSQRQVLLEAAQTALDNMKALELQMTAEAAIAGTGAGLARRAGARVRYVSKQGQPDTLTFTEVDTFPPEINSIAPPYPVQPVCAVSGAPARYRDPLTGLPYANAEAFKELRRRHVLTEQHQQAAQGHSNVH